MPKLSIIALTMTELITIERTIRWYGILRVPEELIGKIYYWRLIADIVREPIAAYYSEGIYNIPRAFLGHLQCLSGQRLLQTYQINATSQLFEKFYGELFYHQAISCSLDAVLKTFENQAPFIPAPPISRINPIRDWIGHRTVPDLFAVKMPSEGGIMNLKLQFALIQECSVDATLPAPSPLPPLPAEPLPPDYPDDGSDLPPISDAYDGFDDGGLTYKPEQDPQEPDYPQGEECQVMRVIVTVTITGSEEPQTFEGFYYGPINDVFLENDDVRVLCRGVAGITGGPCQPDESAESIVENQVQQLISVEIMEA